MLCLSLFRETDAVSYTAQQRTLRLGSLLRSDCAANAKNSCRRMNLLIHCIYPRIYLPMSWVFSLYTSSTVVIFPLPGRTCAIMALRHGQTAP